MFCFFHTCTECARDRDLYKLVSWGKFVNKILFSTIYNTLYLTLGHHELAVILCSCLNFFSVINSLIVLAMSKKPKKTRGSVFLCMKVTIPGTPGMILEKLLPELLNKWASCDFLVIGSDLATRLDSFATNNLFWLSWGQFHQRSTCSFCANSLMPVKYKPKT